MAIAGKDMEAYIILRGIREHIILNSYWVFILNSYWVYCHALHPKQILFNSQIKPSDTCSYSQWISSFMVNSKFILLVHITNAYLHSKSFCSMALQKLRQTFQPLNSLFLNSAVLCYIFILSAPCLVLFSSIKNSRFSALTKLKSKILLIRALLVFNNKKYNNSNSF